MEAYSRDLKLLDKKWLEQPWAANLLNFNLLPSTTLHASWYSQLGEPDVLHKALNNAELTPYLHRHWSDSLLKQNDLGDQLVFAPINLPLQIAILPPALFSKVITLAGAVLSNQRIRQIILRSEVVELEKQISPELIDFARTRASSFYRGLANLENFTIAQIGSQIDQLGGALLLHAMTDATSALVKRIEWRLPIESKEMLTTLNLNASNLTPQLALDLVERLINEVDKTWLSSFQKTR